MCLLRNLINTLLLFVRCDTQSCAMAMDRPAGRDQHLRLCRQLIVQLVSGMPLSVDVGGRRRRDGVREMALDRAGQTRCVRNSDTHWHMGWNTMQLQL